MTAGEYSKFHWMAAAGISEVERRETTNTAGSPDEMARAEQGEFGGLGLCCCREYPQQRTDVEPGDHRASFGNIAKTGGAATAGSERFLFIGVRRSAEIHQGGCEDATRGPYAVKRLIAGGQGGVRTAACS